MILHVLPEVGRSKFDAPQRQVTLDVPVDQTDDQMSKQAKRENPSEEQMPVASKRQIVC